MTKCWRCGKEVKRPFPGMEETHVECECGAATLREGAVAEEALRYLTCEDFRDILTERKARKNVNGLIARLRLLREWVVECRNRDMESYQRVLREIDRTIRKFEAERPLFLVRTDWLIG